MMMKQILLIAALIVLVIGAGCGKSKEATRTTSKDKSVAKVEKVEREKKDTFYCEAPTKDGGFCKRKVKEAGSKCYQHKESK